MKGKEGWEKGGGGRGSHSIAFTTLCDTFTLANSEPALHTRTHIPAH
jgi:hypothetical protein